MLLDPADDVGQFTVEEAEKDFNKTRMLKEKRRHKAWNDHKDLQRTRNKSSSGSSTTTTISLKTVEQHCKDSIMTFHRKKPEKAEKEENFSWALFIPLLWKTKHYAG